MNGVSLLAAGCFVPLGCSPEEVVRHFQSGVRPTAENVERPDGTPASVFRVRPPDAVTRLPRLRRSSRISHLACAAAGQAAARLPGWDASRAGLIVAASDGAVIYTRLFYAGVVAEGNGSPMYFPETVYNAPASHVASLLGMDGEVVSLVSDATAATDALATAAEWIDAGLVDTCLVVAAEEVDGITCAAYEAWRLSGPGSGTTLAEGAVALILGRPSLERVRIAAVDSGAFYGRTCGMEAALEQCVRRLCPEPPDRIVASASGAACDAREARVLERCFPGIAVDRPNLAGGQAFAVSSLTQVIVAAVAVESGTPRVLVPVAGWNGRVGGLVLTGPASAAS